MTRGVDVAASVALRRRLDASLAAEAEWTEQELEWLTLAGNAADRAVQVQGLLDAELSRDELRPLVVVKLSAELRALERTQADLVARLTPVPGPPKSARHVRAANSRWGKVRALRGEA
ncbi:hypothetical protein OG563_06020 [Nocardia vinacea]|uniref:DUF222 domain-containing protein n=1 Tax=Nocardia vinacea TaxID=96468 RepID=A0ABZ1Z060_9NOCA|nr:hypothetical protein [Nocardia vinacea]